MYNELRNVILLGFYLLEDRQWRDGEKRGLDRISQNWEASKQHVERSDISSSHVF